MRRQEGRVGGERERSDHAPQCTGTEPDEGAVSQGYQAALEAGNSEVTYCMDETSTFSFRILAS